MLPKADALGHGPKGRDRRAAEPAGGSVEMPGEVLHRVVDDDGRPFGVQAFANHAGCGGDRDIHRGVPHRTHGVGLTPDETEVWISDQKGQKLFIFDATTMPPAPKGHVELSQGGHGWVTFSLDGKYAWSHTPDVFDVKTKKLVATLRDETGEPVSGSKFVEVHMRDGKLVGIGNEFGLGRKHSD